MRLTGFALVVVLVGFVVVPPSLERVAGAVEDGEAEGVGADEVAEAEAEGEGDSEAGWLTTMGSELSSPAVTAGSTTEAPGAARDASRMTATVAIPHAAASSHFVDDFM